MALTFVLVCSAVTDASTRGSEGDCGGLIPAGGEDCDC